MTRSTPIPLSTMIRAWFLSTVVTRVIRQPRLRLTSRDVADPFSVDVPTRFGHVRCLVTRPAPGAPLGTGLPPVDIHLHGGGFLIGNPGQDGHLTGGISGEVGAWVVNVDYSTSPRVRFPRALEECYDVLDWVAGPGADQGWDPTRISLSGTSAGANLALGVMTTAARRGGPSVRTAALIVPAVDQTLDPHVHTSATNKPFVDRGMLEAVYASYFSDEAERRDPLASPVLLGDELGNLPPLLVVSAGLDTFLPSITDFTTRARAAGIHVQDVHFPDVDHDFYFSKKTASSVMETLMARLRDHLLLHMGGSVD